MIEPEDERSPAWVEGCGQVTLLDVNPVPEAEGEAYFPLLPPLEENRSGG